MKIKNKKILILTFLLSTFSMVFFNSCSSIPKGTQVVTDFDIERYLGTWYEIARLDFRFEKDLDNTMAQYSLNDNGIVKVVNSGYNFKKDKWTSANGKAKFRGNKHSGALKVSFFGPFYSGYNVIAIDDDYKYALVSGKNLDYLWILSREKSLPSKVKKNYLKIADRVGYKTANLIWVKHDKKSPFDE